MSDVTKTNLPTTVHDGFADAADPNAGGVIRGVIIKCVEGSWTDADGAKIPPGTKLLAWATAQALQRWQNKLPVETIIKKPGVPLPDVDELNDKIPQAQWEKGLNGPRPPWVKQQVVYLLDPVSGGEYTFISGTTGAAIATERLRDKVKNMRILRGDRVVPLVELGNKPMPTKFGTKPRPDFTIAEWRNLGPPPAVSAPTPTPALTHEIGTKVAEPSLAEEMNDTIPDFDVQAPDPPAKKVARKAIKSRRVIEQEL
jgi:hypothetical protein